MQACDGNIMDATQMNQENNQEKISIALDGELSESEFQDLLLALESEQGQADWDLYHQIGDVLRSDELAIQLSPGFSSKLAQKLAMEPHYLLPVRHERKEPHHWRQRMWSGMAVAAGLLVVVNIAHTPNELSGGNGLVQSGANAITNVSTNVNARTSDGPAIAPVAANNGVAAKQPRVVSRQGVEVLRDPEIEQYLSAHQRFSPSVYSAVEYARPTTMKKTGTDK
jgi:sigma-E factor negative regulatory protein RseA